TIFSRDWSSDVCSSDLPYPPLPKQLIDFPIAVFVIAHHRMPQVSRMNAYLVRAAGVDPRLGQGRTAEPLDGTEYGSGVLAGICEIGRASCRERAQATGG